MADALAMARLVGSGHKWTTPRKPIQGGISRQRKETSSASAAPVDFVTCPVQGR